MQFIRLKPEGESNIRRKLLFSAFKDHWFAIDDIELLLDHGFVIKVVDLVDGCHYEFGYKDRKMFDDEWELMNGKNAKLSIHRVEEEKNKI